MRVERRHGVRACRLVLAQVLAVAIVGCVLTCVQVDIRGLNDVVGFTGFWMLSGFGLALIVTKMRSVMRASNAE